MNSDWEVGDDHLARIIAQNSSDIVCRLDSAGVIQWVAYSPAGSVGWSREQLLGRPMLDFVVAEDVASAVALAQGVSEGRIVGANPGNRPALRWRTPDGDVRWMSGTGIPQTDEDGQLTGVVVTLRDVTDLVEARLDAEAYAHQWWVTVESMLDPFVVLTAVRNEAGEICDFVFTIANAAAATDQNVAIDDLVGTEFLTLFPHLKDEGIFQAYAHVVDTGEPLIIDDTEVYNDVLAKTRRYDIRGAKAGDSLVLTWRDVTRRHEMQQQLAEQETVYRLATESAYDAILQVDSTGNVLWASPSFSKLAGYAPDDLVGRSAFVLVASEDLAEIQAAFAAAMAGRPVPRREIRIVMADGTRKWVTFRSRVVESPSGGTASLMTMLRDIDEEVVARQSLEQSLGQDPLTGIVTWNVLRAQMGKGERRATALMCISVDRLRAINEAVTYAGGDEVLVEVSKRIAAAIPVQARLGRIAGNEFVVGIPELRDRTLLGLLAEQISTAVAEPVTVAGEEVYPTVSVGIAQAEVRPDELLRRASLAMRAVKAEGGGHWLFDDPVVAAEAERRLWVESRVRKALAAGAIVPWFQPVVRLHSGELVGYEALARWPQGDGSVLPPSEFLAVSETNGLVVDLDFAVLRKALSAMATKPDVTVSVNVSARTLASPDYVERVGAVLDETGYDASRLRLEVTETALLYDSTRAARVTSALAIKGVKWWLDDFGTGYSTLTHLRDFPISGIKLDRSFTVGVGEEDLASTRLARALVGMAQGLGLETVAEGVETHIQARLLREQGWQNGQGWLYGKAEPLPED